MEEEKKSEIAKREEATLTFWQEHNIFTKTLEKDSPKGEFVFYDGPPFATGLPHYGHLVGGTMKDVVPRFKTMQGFHVPRRWGWDTHGLPIENLIEKELGLKSKKDIEELGIEKFNDAARAAVFRYDKEWKQIIPRTGRFIDMDNAYVTMHPTYSESIWWSFKTLHEKNLIYNGFKSMMLCPHCGTTLSNFEVAQGYKDITDISVYVKFQLTDEPDTYVLAWTTTPWTLPGNVALAVGKDIEYVKVKIENDFVILAKERMSALKDKPYEIVEEIRGKDLVGKTYKPVFDYYQNGELKNKENGWKIVAADFVTTTDGTGVVHIAPAFGEDDYNLSLKENLPFIQHVGQDGAFKKEVTDFAGMSVKPKSDDEKERIAADIAVIKYLQEHGTFFAKEKLVHSYPHCWRCDTPLLNYATSSWFVKVTDLKDKLVAENNKVSWIPADIGEGRFGKWLENARDWAISRSRYWGAPLPVWQNEDGSKKEIIGSVADIKKHTKRNTYFVVRHGEAQSNIKNILNCIVDPENCLTDNGKKIVEESAQTLIDKKIDLIISSDLQRTKDTAEIIAKALGIAPEKIVYDERLREYNFGDYDGKTRDEWHAYWKDRPWSDADVKVPGGESPNDVRNRVGECIYETDRKYEGKTILIVSHQDPISYLQCVAEGKSVVYLNENYWEQYALKNAEVRKLDFAFIPHNRNYELDLHRPYIDEVAWTSPQGELMKRVPEVFDTWYESGSMPYASNHYPFENKDTIDAKKFFPADFIAEGQDQTRGWFYSLLVLSTGLFEQAPYKNVIVNGTVLAEDGQKMSKRLKNYPELSYVLDKYGADAMRYYLMSSPVVHAEDLAFSEKGVDEVVKKLLMRLQNVYTFYATYKDEENQDNNGVSNNILDQWITARLAEINRDITSSLEKYELDRAAKPLMGFIDDLSTWYLRRSRDRFKGENALDKQHALHTTRYVLRELSKLMAPITPFVAEDVYQKVKGSDGKESVHLESWPTLNNVDEKIIADMKTAREIVEMALSLRAKQNLKVRQPLAALILNAKKYTLDETYLEVIQDEVNVKRVAFADTLGDEPMALDTVVTPELKREGQARDLIRLVQELRKKMKLNPGELVRLSVTTNEDGQKLIETFKTDISKTAQLSEIIFIDTEGESLAVDDLSFVVAITK